MPAPRQPLVPLLVLPQPLRLLPRLAQQLVLAQRPPLRDSGKSKDFAGLVDGGGRKMYMECQGKDVPP